MIEKRVTYALKNVLNEKYFESQQEWYELLEHDKSGKARIILNVGTTDNICVKNYDSIPIWEILREGKKFHIRKRIDHFILRKNSGIWELHMIEIKKTVRDNVWQDIKFQMSASYLTIKALLTFLGISIVEENVFAYTAYFEDKMIGNDSASEGVTTKVFKTGERLQNPKIEEWDAGFINILMIDSNGDVYSERLKHTKIKMNVADNGILEQKFSLPI